MVRELDLSIILQLKVKDTHTIIPLFLFAFHIFLFQRNVAMQHYTNTNQTMYVVEFFTSESV